MGQDRDGKDRAGQDRGEAGWGRGGTRKSRIDGDSGMSKSGEARRRRKEVQLLQSHINLLHVAH